MNVELGLGSYMPATNSSRHVDLVQEYILKENLIQWHQHKGEKSRIIHSDVTRSCYVKGKKQVSSDVFQEEAQKEAGVESLFPPFLLI